MQKKTAGLRIGLRTGRLAMSRRGIMEPLRSASDSRTASTPFFSRFKLGTEAGRVFEHTRLPDPLVIWKYPSNRVEHARPLEAAESRAMLAFDHVRSLLHPGPKGCRFSRIWWITSCKGRQEPYSAVPCLFLFLSSLTSKESHAPYDPEKI